MATRATEINAELRTEFGKGASRRLRREGRVPAVVYGQERAPQHISFDAHEIFMATKGNANALLDVTAGDVKQLMLVRERQINPLSRKIDHVDLIRVDRDQKVEVQVPVEITGEPQTGFIATAELLELAVLAPVTDIPELITVNVEGLDDSARITVADLDLPADVQPDVEADELVVSVARPQVDRALEEADAAMAEAQSAESQEEAKEAAAPEA